jgi:hypothetical protein
MSDAPVDSLRRELLKLGVAGSVALSAVSLGAGLSGCHAREESSAAGFVALRDGDVTLLRALLPAILAGAMPQDATERDARIVQTLSHLDQMAQRLAPASLHALRQLFDLMSFAPARRLACGVPPWSEASAGELEAFLQRWRNSSIGLFNAGYRALVKLGCASCFTLPST